MSPSPYRADASPVRLPVLRSEAPTCMWCAWSRSGSQEVFCLNPVHNPNAYSFKNVDRLGLVKDGALMCRQYLPSRTTWLLRLFGLRRPAMIDAWDREDW